MNYIYGKDLTSALDSEYRVYLCGSLKKPQALKYIHDEKNEMGISHYRKFTADLPHLHTQALEYNYLISGSSKILILDTGEEFVFEEGSIFVIPPMTKYASKHLADTKILFFKSPGGNDKQLIEVDDKVSKWLSAW